MSINMKSHFVTAVVAVGLLTFSFAPVANAMTLDFIAEANGNERGVLDGHVINNANTGGISIGFSATGGSAYFDSGGAGLGVCGTLTGSFQCNPSNDDNVTSGEAVKLAFVDATLSSFFGLSFRDANHNAVSAMDTLLIGINNAAGVSYTFAAAAAASWSNVDSITFTYGGAKANEFYVSGATAVVPLPAGLVLLISGLAGLGFLGRSRSKAA